MASEPLTINFPLGTPWSHGLLPQKNLVFPPPPQTKWWCVGKVGNTQILRALEGKLVEYSMVAAEHGRRRGAEELYGTHRQGPNHTLRACGHSDVRLHLDPYWTGC